MSEWLGVRLAGNADVPVWLLRAVKCADYILTPMAGVAFVMEVHIRNYWRRLLIALLAVNTLFKLIAAFGGWMVRVDAQHHYSHGPLYPAYIALYIVVMALVGVQFILYGRNYRRQNRTSLYAILALVLIGIAMQEFSGGGIRIAYIALTFGAADCIRRALGSAYRIGGDEFVYMGSMNRTQANEAMARLHLVTSTWRGERVGKLSVSAGCALSAEHPGASAEELARKADKEMYAAKARYYRESGIDRRRR